METGAVFLFIVVVFCVFLGFVTATAIVYRKQVKELKRIATVNSSMIRDMSQEMEKQTQAQAQTPMDVANMLDSDGISALLESMSKAGK